MSESPALDRFLSDLECRSALARARERDVEFQADLAALGLTSDDRLIAWLRTIRPPDGTVDRAVSSDDFAREFVREVVKQNARRAPKTDAMGQ